MRQFRMCIIGCGNFAQTFVPQFQNHPAISEVLVCDKVPERAMDYQNRFHTAVVPSFEAALADPTIDAVGIFTERHRHGPMVVAALRAGKHVYSAVPMASTPEECIEILKTVKETHKIYMMGETCIYYPSSMYCKREYEKGTFGNFVYAEAQYYHDLSHFPQNFIDDRPASAVPPFLYPTHSTAMVLWATGAYVTRVTAFGYRDREPDTPFRKGENYWDNEFSNEYALMQLSNGGVARINECRRIGYKAPSSSVSSFYGTKASYQFNNAQHLLVRMNPDGGLPAVLTEDVSTVVNPYEMEAHRADPDFKQAVSNHKWQSRDFAPIQDAEVARLPESFRDLQKANGHMGSHHLLVDDFCTAVANGQLPRVHAWLAARFTIPGLLAHESAKKNGMPIDVPDTGDVPKNFQIVL